MKVSLIQHGNDLAVVIDKSVLEQLQITADTKLEMMIHGDAILLRPVRDEVRQERIRKSMLKINDKFGDAFRRLAE